MDKMTSEEWQQVGEAILVWSGWGRSSWPLRNDEPVAKRFGSEIAATLLPLIRQLEDEFYASDARHTAADLAEMASISSQQFAAKYPELPDDAVRALAWCYTFDYK
ncbi:MAG: hypothetical protein IPK13_12710 [Deltaproteobacteria bacterium]|nr:hypothetical protein [Deltaproteobacteria bacterium]